MKSVGAAAISFLSLIFASSAFAGAFPSEPRTFPVFVALINAGNGSGAYLRISNSVYLVTAKHVLFADPVGTNAPALRAQGAILKSYFGESTNVTERVLMIDLGRLLAADEIRYSTNRDVALVRIEDVVDEESSAVRMLPGVTSLLPQSSLVMWGKDGALCPIREVDVGADAYMFGYPTSLTGRLAGLIDPTEPLLRKGVVAGINTANSVIIVDCPSYFGNSGGPVVQVERDWSQTKFRLIGIVSGLIPFEETWENQTMRYSHVIKSNSGYTVLVPIDIITDLAWK